MSAKLLKKSQTAKGMAQKKRQAAILTDGSLSISKTNNV